MNRVILFNKPYGVLSQFTDKGTQGSARPTLSGFIDEPGFYPAGRLDKDSEGLMVLTDNGALQARIAHPKYKRPKTYLVQVEGMPDAAALDALRKGVTLKDGLTKPAPATMTQIDRACIRFGRTRPAGAFSQDRSPMPCCEITIREGRNRQVRRMTAHVGLPTLRLIRESVGDWTLAGLQPGAWRWSTETGR